MRERPRPPVARRRELPRTGANLLGATALAAGLTASGAGALREARRREQLLGAAADQGPEDELRSELDIDGEL